MVLLRALLRRRDELRVVLMSATLDAQSFSDYFARPGGMDWGGDVSAAAQAAAARGLAGPPAPLMSVPTKPRHPVEMFYVEVRHADSVTVLATSSTPSCTHARHVIHHIVHPCSPRHPPHCLHMLATRWRCSTSR